jgi:hypothetical protein
MDPVRYQWQQPEVEFWQLNKIVPNFRIRQKSAARILLSINSSGVAHK